MDVSWPEVVDPDKSPLWSICFHVSSLWKKMAVLDSVSSLNTLVFHIQWMEMRPIRGEICRKTDSLAEFFTSLAFRHAMNAGWFPETFWKGLRGEMSKSVDAAIFHNSFSQTPEENVLKIYEWGRVRIQQEKNRVYNVDNTERNCKK